MIRYLRWLVGWLGLLSSAIVLQLYLAGYGVFRTREAWNLARQERGPQIALAAAALKT